jgi:hypothetical protein
MSTEKRGGAGRGQGRHLKYNEQTKSIQFRCPLSRVEELREIVYSTLKEWGKVAKNKS